MTAADRSRLRNAINTRARARLLEDAIASACTRCGCDNNTLTPGCKTCWNRHRARGKRAVA